MRKTKKKNRHFVCLLLVWHSLCWAYFMSWNWLALPLPSQQHSAVDRCLGPRVTEKTTAWNDTSSWFALLQTGSSFLQAFILPHLTNASSILLWIWRLLILYNYQILKVQYFSTPSFNSYVPPALQMSPLSNWAYLTAGSSWYQLMCSTGSFVCHTLAPASEMENLLLSRTLWKRILQ